MDDTKDIILTIAIHGSPAREDTKILPSLWMQENTIDSLQAFQDPLLKLSSAMIEVKTILIPAG